jgi:hypothetical protein
MTRAVVRTLTGRPAAILAACGGVFAASLVILFLVDLENRYRDAVANAKQTAVNYAAMLGADAARTFEGIDRTLRVAEIAYRDAQVGPRASAADRLAAARRAYEAVDRIQRTSSVLLSIGMLSATCW